MEEIRLANRVCSANQFIRYFGMAVLERFTQGDPEYQVFCRLLLNWGTGC